MQHYLGVFDTEQIAALKYAEKAAELGGQRAGAAAVSSASAATSSANSTEHLGAGDAESFRIAMIGLGRTIRALAELNSELSRSLMQSSCLCRGPVMAVVIETKIQEQLGMQAMYIRQIKNSIAVSEC